MASDFRVLLAPEEVDHANLGSLYASPEGPWFRANMVATVNGVAAGPDGRSGSINNQIDREVFALLRSQADAIVVGAGTARTEEYRPTDRPIVVVSGSGAVPPQLVGADQGAVLLATSAGAPHLAESQEILGMDSVVVVGADAVDLGHLREDLIGRGLRNLLCEGGPRLLTSAIAAGIVDEICLTWVPRILGAGTQPLLTGAEFDLTLKLQMLLEGQGALLGRWWL
jgi:riboflavin biosynthesis pyrimidine reductase